MDELETDDLQLLYLDPFQTYLTPLVASTFYNSLQFQRRVFEWTPSEKTMVLMTDLADYGNASAGASPRNGVTLYVAPPSRTLETMPSSERMYSLMNHEAVHVANVDVANSRDLRWRRFFGGKPRSDRGTPGDDPLQLPHGAAPQRAALVLRRRGDLHGNLDGGGHRPGPGRLRRNGVPRDGPRRRAFLQQPRPGIQGRCRGFPDRAPTPTCTARGSSATSLTSIRRRPWSNG